MYYDSGRFARFIPRGATDNFIFCFPEQPMSFIYIQLFDCCLDSALFFFIKIGTCNFSYKIVTHGFLRLNVLTSFLSSLLRLCHDAVI